jgi:NAD-dependent SIR2 family protein deacetylase
MNTAISTSSEKQEYFDSNEDVDLKLTQLAQWIKESNYIVAFTGAGISTAAGIADLRSGVNTVLETGPGIYEREVMGIKNYKAKVNTPLVLAIPTRSHMALAKLMDTGKLKYVISQTIDGLHLKSGISHDRITELYGNAFIERCSLCKKHYLRDFPVLTGQVHHKTGNICEDKSCRAELVDTKVGEHELMDKKALQEGFEQAAKADLIICIGSSMRTHPPSEMPLECLKNNGRIVMINLQKTPIDDHCSLVLHGKIEDIIPELMNKLAIDIPKFKLSRRVRFILTPGKDGKKVLEVRAIEKDGAVNSVFTKMIVTTGGSKYISNSEPFEFMDNFVEPFTIDLHFQGYYGEPPIELTLSPGALYNRIYLLEYDLEKKKWDFSYTLSL